MERTRTTWIIFQSRNGAPTRNDGWLDYCREAPPHGQDASEWATREAASLARRIGCECRFKIEVW